MSERQRTSHYDSDRGAGQNDRPNGTGLPELHLDRSSEHIEQFTPAGPRVGQQRIEFRAVALPPGPRI
jgi:hypothetical protein